VNARCIASGGSKMDVQVVCSHVCELTLYCRFDVSPFDDFPARHHPRGIKAAHGEGAFAKLLRDLPDSIEGFLTAANVDGKPHCSRSQGESFSKTWRAPLRSSETRDGLLLWLTLLEALIRSPGRVLKCPLMAQSGHDLVRRTCLLSRLTRTSTIAGRMAVGCAVELAMHRAAAWLALNPAPNPL